MHASERGWSHVVMHQSMQDLSLLLLQSEVWKHCQGTGQARVKVLGDLKLCCAPSPTLQNLSTGRPQIVLCPFSHSSKPAEGPSIDPSGKALSMRSIQVPVGSLASQLPWSWIIGSG